jgi:methionyl-tRNA synthetase
MTRTSDTILITAALPYANGYLHLGHLAGAYLPADMYARFQRLMGKSVLFLCGSDEHGVAITVSADAEKTTPTEIIDRYHPDNASAFTSFGMSFDHYSRTSLPIHHDTAKDFFSSFHSHKILHEKNEKQLYCLKDAMFLADRYVEGTCPVCGNEEARGDQCEQCGSWLNQTELKDATCRLCGSTPEVRSTQHWYFPLNEYQDRLKSYIAERDTRDGWRENVKRYCESWFTAGLQERAVTRDISWGVSVPVQGYEQKVIYVWFDAVLGYISAGKEWAAEQGKPDEWRRFWQNEDTKYVAFIGKDNIVFHCIVFPAMLMAWNDNESSRYVLPENVPANEFLNLEGEKFSKSRGWGIDLRDFLKFYPADYLRYALAVNLPENKDADFSLEDFRARINNELADSVGNFVNRSVTFVSRNFENAVPPYGQLNSDDEAFISLLETAPARIGSLYEAYKFRDAVQQTMALARAANKYFNDNAPWKTVKDDTARAGTSLRICLRAVHTLGVLLSPVIPAIARDMLATVGMELKEKDPIWKTAGGDPFSDGHPIDMPKVLVPKIEEKDIAAMTDALTSADDSSKVQENLITIEDVGKLELRVGIVLEAEQIPKSKKLLRISVDLGSEKRQVVAGIASQYQPEDLIGKQIVIVANLKPAKLMGVESQGMLLAAHSDDGVLTLVTTDAPIKAGSKIK